MEKYKKSITEYNDVKNCMAYAKKEGKMEVIMMLVSSGMPYTEISNRLKMPVEDVKSILTTSYN
jgi:DNA-binding CsgD family transcriptional regulator